MTGLLGIASDRAGLELKGALIAELGKRPLLQSTRHVTYH